MLKHWRPLVIGFAGAALCLLLWHVWEDHMIFHQIVGAINQANAQAAKKQP